MQGESVWSESLSSAVEKVPASSAVLTLER